eukprot:CAMPEP_0197386818 /NCGR_PEP_ID=MMETSP1165-20131217/119_1 /TAXON_ID=284809 /ORGANISM="Chrysocystis fragilis, Strain CCMP3189" /LENGTH=295 /DNA_ID=CAMNT_0042912079 /DNA_START=48 /DNA_END=932 /DNA_ORIENTATION=+
MPLDNLRTGRRRERALVSPELAIEDVGEHAQVDVIGDRGAGSVRLGGRRLLPADGLKELVGLVANVEEDADNQELLDESFVVEGGVDNVHLAVIVLAINGMLGKQMEMELEGDVVSALVHDLAGIGREDDLEVVAGVDDLAARVGAVRVGESRRASRGREGIRGDDVNRRLVHAVAGVPRTSRARAPLARRVAVVADVAERILASLVAVVALGRGADGVLAHELVAAEVSTFDTRLADTERDSRVEDVTAIEGLDRAVVRGIGEDGLEVVVLVLRHGGRRLHDVPLDDLGAARRG